MNQKKRKSAVNSQHEVDEPQKSYRQILQEEVVHAVTELKRRPFGLFLSGVSAGLDIGFSLLLIAVAETHISGQLPTLVTAILVANMYAVGFIFVVIGRSELFTEHTTLAVLPVLSGQASIKQLARLWTVVYVANLIGAAVFAGLIVMVGPAMGIIDPKVFAKIADPLIGHTGTTTFLSAMLAGWLMGLLSWLVTAARDTISQIFIVWLIATVIGFAHLHHAIVGSVEVFAAIFAGQEVTFSNYGHFLLWTTLGNAVGGGVFVALLKYSHASRELPDGAA